MNSSTPSTPSTPYQPRRRFLRAIFGNSLFFGLLAWNLIRALRLRHDTLSFIVRPPRADPDFLYTTELLHVDWVRQVWYWPRHCIERYWSDPHYFPAGAEFTAEFRGVVLFRGRITHALDAARADGITLRVLQLRSGPASGPLLSGNLGFAFALTDAAGRPQFPCSDARITTEIRTLLREQGVGFRG